MRGMGEWFGRPGRGPAAYVAGPRPESPRFRTLAGTLAPLGGRVVKLRPGVLAAEDQIGQQQAGVRAVRHAGAGVAGGDEDVVGVHWVAADKRQAVDRLHDLARPAKFGRAAARP